MAQSYNLRPHLGAATLDNANHNTWIHKVCTLEQFQRVPLLKRACGGLVLQGINICSAAAMCDINTGVAFWMPWASALPIYLLGTQLSMNCADRHPQMW